MEPTVRQLAAHELLAAFNDAGKIDWGLVEANCRTVAEADGYDSPVTDTGRTVAARINEALLTGREVLPADLDAVRYAIEQARSTRQLELVDGIPVRYWQEWLIENWLPANCVAVLTGDGGVGKSRLALQLAWALSGDGSGWEKPDRCRRLALTTAWASNRLGRGRSCTRQGEVRPTHAPKKRKRRGIRTRPDPFEGVRCEILDWLQQHPDVKAAELLDRLMARYPNRYSGRQLRTLQPRVRQWRIVVAKQLVYAPAEQSELNEADLGDITPVSDN